MRADYSDYARAFLLTDRRVHWVVCEALDILWLCWSEAAASANLNHYAWQLFRSRVMLRAPRHTDGRPDLRAAVFSTHEVRGSDSTPGHFMALTELIDLFDVLTRLPNDQMDLTVLHYLCGTPAARIAHILGMAPALTHAVDHHARPFRRPCQRPHPGVIPLAMTAIDRLLARARLHPQPGVPDDTVPYEDTPYPTSPAATPAAGADRHHRAAARQLRILCETAISTLTSDTLDFLTDRVPDLHTAWLLGCALHVAGIEHGARFWWQYAAGDGHPAACYCLSLHHLTRGETHAAAFYQEQAHPDAAETDSLTVAGSCPPRDISFDSSVPTVLRILSHLAATGPGRRRRHRIDALTNYVADTVTRHYTRHPSVEPPVPEPLFADRAAWLLTASLPWPRARTRRDIEPTLPARRPPRPAPGPSGGRASEEGMRSVSR
ncbi:MULTISPECIES: sigma-70 RNA polymerase sigma factor region 4 domain-containing protein [Streptomyces]|uniref:hypothetical protein n=1 Tax=Streptomyces tendae TaxID=1932 RepID=UPI00381EC4D5